MVGPFVFKALLDKANSDHLRAIAGQGCARAAILGALRREGYPILTDIHEPAQAEPVAEVADILRDPGILCRQTELLLAAGRTGRIVNIKKDSSWRLTTSRTPPRVASTGNSQVLLTERGSSFGPQQPGSGYGGLKIMRDLGWPAVIFDATHSVQLPSGGGCGLR